MSDNALQDKADELAIAVVKVNEELCAKRKFSLADQLLRSGTSVGANISEAPFAHSRADFISKMQIAGKECCETKYWLRILRLSGVYENEVLESLVESIRRMLAASVKTAKQHAS